MAWSGLSVLGPMGRTVADTALLLSAMAGPDPRSPIALPEPGERFAAPLGRDFRGVRVAWSRDLGGLPVDPSVSAALAPGRARLEDLGCQVEDAEPDLSGAAEVFDVLRAWIFAARFAGASKAVLDQVKDTVRWNVERGRALSADQVGRAEVERGLIFQRMHAFMQRYEFLALPVSQVPPFPVEERWVREIDGEQMQTYIDWMKSCSMISVTEHPAISVPCGFTPAGLPVGLQIIGRHRDDWGVLQIARAFAFPAYSRSLGFANAVAWIANTEGHHPDLEVSYRECVVNYTTHAIDGLSENDFICAAKIDRLVV
jgi:amidase